jgi:carbon monoxide dehydrogenase subunit G
MAGNLDTTAEVLGRADDGQQVRYRVVSKGVGSNSTVDATISVEPGADGSTVRWVADLVELGGLLKMVPRGLMQAAAQKVIADVWESVRPKLAD